jgi:carbamoyltransferase
MLKCMNILSIHFGHDSSACILKDGEIVLYFKEERFSRRKRDNIPIISIKKCIENFKEEITHIIITSTAGNNLLFVNAIKFISSFIKLPNNKNIINFISNHHLSHAGISFFNSGFEKAIVIVADGGGSSYKKNKNVYECESIYLMSYDKPITTILKNYFVPATFDLDNLKDIKINKNYKVNLFKKIGGIVNVYTTATLLIGQNIFENGKTMGLSSYGEKILNFPKIFINEYCKPNSNYYEIYNYKNTKEPFFIGHYKKITNKITQDNYKFYADYAYEIQTQTQEAVGNLIENSIKKTGIRKVCISGGYGMNVVANHYYLKRFPDVDFYFEPIADDTGGAIGAAKIFWHFQTKDKTVRPLKTTSFHGVHYDVSPYKGVKKSVKDIAKLLYEDKSVAVYSGLAEAGQRALGNRSIFFNALNPDAKDLVNKIKKREWYRPFAAVVLEEDASIYFDMGRVKSSPFMTICFPVREEYVKIIPGVTHVDNTCRIQTVSKDNGYLYKLLQEFKKLSGHGILLNTSFNLAGAPLVEAPKEAFNTLINSSLDYLWFEETQQLFSKNIFKSFIKPYIKQK